MSPAPRYPHRWRSYPVIAPKRSIFAFFFGIINVIICDTPQSFSHQVREKSLMFNSPSCVLLCSLVFKTKNSEPRASRLASGAMRPGEAGAKLRYKSGKRRRRRDSTSGDVREWREVRSDRLPSVERLQRAGLQLQWEQLERRSMQGHKCGCALFFRPVSRVHVG